MKKAHRDRDQSVRGHSTLTKAELERDMRFERMSLAYGASGVPNSPNPVCACHQMRSAQALNAER